MGREFELKYRATPEQQAGVFAAFSGFSPIAMETTYYDTPAGDLGKLRWTLRRRYENGRSICTLKTPADGGARGEWELECGDITAAIPELCKLSGSHRLLLLSANGLVPVCGARFTRQAAQVEREGTALELALDSGVLLGGGRELPLCEIEVELKSGSEEAALRFARDLADRFGLIPEGKSKYRRALALVNAE